MSDSVSAGVCHLQMNHRQTLLDLYVNHRQTVPVYEPHNHIQRPV